MRCRVFVHRPGEVIYCFCTDIHSDMTPMSVEVSPPGIENIHKCVLSLNIARLFELSLCRYHRCCVLASGGRGATPECGRLTPGDAPIALRRRPAPSRQPAVGSERVTSGTVAATTVNTDLPLPSSRVYRGIAGTRPSRRYDNRHYY